MPKLRIEEAKNYNIGSIEDIAYCIPLKFLEHGIVISNTEESFEEIKKNCEYSGFRVDEVKCADGRIIK